MSMKNTSRLLRSACVIVAVTAAAFLGGAQDGSAATPEPLMMSYVPGNAGSWDIFVGIEKGMFAKEGFTPQRVILQNAIESAQLMVTGAVNMAVAQSAALLTAISHGAQDIKIIAAPENRIDWYLSARPDIKTAKDLKGKLVGSAQLQAADSWLTEDWIDSQGLTKKEWAIIAIGTSGAKFAALQRGSIAAAILYQPVGFLAEARGFTTLYHFADGKPMPPLLYAVNQKWAAEKKHGIRLSHALVEAHHWLIDPANKAEAMAILKKYNKQDDAITEKSYEYFIGKRKLMNDDAAVDIAGLNNEIAVMMKHGGLPPGITTLSPNQYMLPKKLGGLYH